MQKAFKPLTSIFIQWQCFSTSQFLYLMLLFVFWLSIFNTIFIVAKFGFAYVFTFCLVMPLFPLLQEIINDILCSSRCKQLNYDSKKIEWEISEGKIIIRLVNLSESTFTWEYIKGILDTPLGFLLYPEKNQFYLLPKKEFNSKEDIAQFVYLAKDKVKNWQRIK